MPSTICRESLVHAPLVRMQVRILHASARYPLILPMQDSSDRLCQLSQHKWLHQESTQTYGLCLFLIDMVAKASAQNDGNIWTNAPQLFGQPLPCHARHRHIRDHQVEVIWLPAK